MPGLIIDGDKTALVIADPQNDFLSPNGVAWNIVGKSVTENNTVPNLKLLLEAAKSAGMKVFVSPHFYYPTDRKWKFGGTLVHLMHDINMFAITSPIDFSKLTGSGADFHPDLKKFIEDGNTVITSPHKVYGPSTNDLCLQLRKNGVAKVILAGMSANLCIESHLRELLEQGFEVAIIKDAIAGGQFQGLDGYRSALINFRFIANDILDTKTAVSKIKLLNLDLRPYGSPKNSSQLTPLYSEGSNRVGKDYTGALSSMILSEETGGQISSRYPTILASRGEKCMPHLVNPVYIEPII